MTLRTIVEPRRVFTRGVMVPSCLVGPFLTNQNHGLPAFPGLFSPEKMGHKNVALTRAFLAPKPESEGLAAPIRELKTHRKNIRVCLSVWYQSLNSGQEDADSGRL